MKNLSETGLSMSQAQSISNMANQRCQEINNKISVINNVSKTLVVGKTTYTDTVGNPMPLNIVSLLKEKSSLHACQAFLMENIKEKDALLKKIKEKEFVMETPRPGFPEMKSYINVAEVTEAWGKEQLPLKESNEYLEAEAFAAHIGQFIHKDSKLDKLRKELPSIKTLEWITIKEGEKTPLIVTVHHTSEQLLAVYEELATLHRGYEMTVNKFLAKIKTSVTTKNAEIKAKNVEELTKVTIENAEIRAKYDSDLQKWHDDYRIEEQKFEKKREESTKTAANLRIQVDPRFQTVIDQFLTKLA